MKGKHTEGVGVLTIFVAFSLACDFLILLSILAWWWIQKEYPPAEAWTWLGLVFGGELLITGGINVAGKVRDWKLGKKDDNGTS